MNTQIEAKAIEAINQLDMAMYPEIQDVTVGIVDDDTPYVSLDIECYRTVSAADESKRDLQVSNIEIKLEEAGLKLTPNSSGSGEGLIKSYIVTVEPEVVIDSVSKLCGTDMAQVDVHWHLKMLDGTTDGHESRRLGVSDAARDAALDEGNWDLVYAEVSEQIK